MLLQSANDVLVQLEEHETPKFFFSLLAIRRGKIFFPHMLQMPVLTTSPGSVVQDCDTQPDAPSRTLATGTFV